MKLRIPAIPMKWVSLIGGIAVLVAAVIWWPRVNEWTDRVLIVTGARQAELEEAEAEAPAAEVSHLELSERALRNLGLTSDYIRPVELTTFRRTIALPATIVERPGQTRIQISAPMTGVVAVVHPVQSAAIEPGSILFQIRLTHEDLVQAQTDFLRTLGQLDVELREIERLQDVSRSGAVAGIRVLERMYEREKLEAVLSAQKESLRLHGLSADQVGMISEERRLLSELQIFAPPAGGSAQQETQLTKATIRPTSRNVEEAEASTVVLQEMRVHQGEAVTTGQTLCVLADYSLLYVEGLAFEQDSSSLAFAAQNDWPLTAVFDEPGEQSRIIDDLAIAFLSNEVDPEARTLKLYARLPNRVVREETDEDGNRFITWEFRPGRRLQMLVPVEEWSNQIVLPVDAVAKEGAEFFVFVQNGRHFDRVPVHVKYRDQFSVVIANDGALFPGTYVAMRGAHQMQMALKNMSGGAADPHAGHSH